VAVRVGNQVGYVFKLEFLQSATASAPGVLTPAAVNAIIAQHSAKAYVTLIPPAIAGGYYTLEIIPQALLVSTPPPVNGGFGSLSRANEFGIRPYNEMRNELSGTGLQAHHIIEQRFTNQSSNLTVAVTPAEHQVFTNKWRGAFPYRSHPGYIPYDTISAAQLWNEAQSIYADFPSILEAVRIALGF